MKRYGDTPIQVTENAAEKVTQALQSGSEFISVKGTTIAAKAISGVEKSLERIEENIYLLGTGKGKVVLGLDFEENGTKYSGAVVTNWYKKNIDKREWDTYYSKNPCYKRIDDVDSSVWVAVRLAEETNSEKPLYLVACTKEESRGLSARV